MKKAVMLFLGLFVVAFLASAAYAQEEPAGKKLFMDNKCNMCHSITSQTVEKKMAASKAPDLSNVGSTRDAAWITKWLNKEVDIEGKKHPATVKLADADTKTLTDWLATLKTAAK